MAPHLKTLVGKSFQVIPGELYNQYRQDVAEQNSQSFLFYEVSLMEEKSWEFLRDRVYPRFARYLKAKRFNPTEAKGVIVAVFHEERCYLLTGEDFLQAFRETEGLDLGRFHLVVQQWLKV